MHTFTEHCNIRDNQLNEFDWSGLMSPVKEKLGKWFGGQRSEPEQKVNIGGRRLGSSDVSVRDTTGRKPIGPEDANIARRLGKNIESRLSNTSLFKALINYGYTNQEAQDIISKNPVYEPIWNKFLMGNESLKNIYLSSWKKEQRDTVRRILQRMFDMAFGQNVIGMPALLVPQPEAEPAQQITDIDIMNTAKPLILRGEDPKKVMYNLFIHYWRQGVHVPSLKGRITKAVNIVVDKLNQQGKLGPKRIVRGTQRTVVPQQEPVAEPTPLRLYQ